MNIQLVESLLQVILALPTKERLWLEKKLFENLPYPSTNELMNLIESGKALNFLHDEVEKH